MKLLFEKIDFVLLHETSFSLAVTIQKYVKATFDKPELSFFFFFIYSRLFKSICIITVIIANSVNIETIY